MNYHERYAAEQAAACAQAGLTRTEVTLFVTVNYGAGFGLEHLPMVAHSEVDYMVDGVHPGPTVDECRVAMNDCLAKGWLRVVDDAMREQHAAELRQRGVIGPVYGLPRVGKVDFTPVGADLWFRYLDAMGSDRESSFPFTRMIRSTRVQCYRTEAVALESLQQAQADPEVAAVRGPIPIGPWRVQWWRWFPQGYRIEIDRYCHDGLLGMDAGEEYHFATEYGPLDQQKLHRILERYQVTLAEWRIFEELETDYLHDRAGLCGSARKRGRFTRAIADSISEEQAAEAFESCVRHGWIRVADQQADAEINALLQRDPAFLAMPKTATHRRHDPAFCFYGDTFEYTPFSDRLPPKREWDRIDFTPIGAALYRTIAAEWQGEAWEDSVYATRCTSWKMHLYCNQLKGLANIGRIHEALGEHVDAARLVPLGPWCVSWWQEFPAGYRLEVEVTAGD